ncbi:hypothetical protein CLV78_1011002 [Aliiruegeria haliotis]|uniref:Uncharacterized protein n=1 Tax=Aliiruegeria haliotis TaxID=1280846 RepID=A0A2T0S0E1_9RHOB|nr:hypothetical protein CLV78_1011002 [Aliiruegeria haliotis]
MSVTGRGTTTGIAKVYRQQCPFWPSPGTQALPHARTSETASRHVLRFGHELVSLPLWNSANPSADLPRNHAPRFDWHSPCQPPDPHCRQNR